MAFSVFRSKLLLASFAIGMLDKAFVSLVRKFAEQERQLAQLGSVLRSTGFSSGLVTIQLDSMAKGLASVTRFGDEAIHSVQKLLLTFTNIKEDVFPDALSLTLDMAEALGTDTKSAAIQLGKALNDPLKGFTALRRVGVSFTKTQEQQIKSFAKLGNVAAAQKIILSELKKEFGGIAQNAGTASTRIALLSEAWGDFQERLGEALAPAILPVLKFVTDLLNSTKSESEKLIETLGLLEQTPAVKEAQIRLLQEQLSSIEGVDKIVNAFATDSMPMWQAATHDVGKAIEKLDADIKKQQKTIGEGTVEVLNFANANNMTIKELKEFVKQNDVVTRSANNRHGAVTQNQEEEMAQNLAAAGITEELKKKILSLNNAELTRIKQLLIEKAAMSEISVKLVELGIVLDFISGKQDDAIEKWKLWGEAALQAISIQTNAFSAMTSAQSASVNAREKSEIDALKETASYKRMSSKRQQAEEKKISDKFADEKRKIWKQEKAIKLSQAIMSGYTAVTKAYEQFGYPWGIIPAGLVAAMVAEQVSAIQSTPMPAFAKGGDFIADRPQPILVGEAGRERVTITPIDRPESMALGSMGGVNINFSGNVLSQDFIEDEAIPMIKEAIRRGADIGVA